MSGFTGARVGYFAQVYGKAVFMSVQITIGGKVGWLPCAMKWAPEDESWSLTNLQAVKHFEVHAFTAVGIDLKAALPQPMPTALAEIEFFGAYLNKTIISSSGLHNHNYIYLGMKGDIGLRMLGRIDLINVSILYRVNDHVFEIYGSALSHGIDLPLTIVDAGSFIINPGELSLLGSGSPTLRLEVRYDDFKTLAAPFRAIGISRR